MFLIYVCVYKANTTYLGNYVKYTVHEKGGGMNNIWLGFGMHVFNVVQDVVCMQKWAFYY